MKKLITIILVLVMLVSILVLPASAASIQPRYPVGICGRCGNSNTEYRGIESLSGLLCYRYYCLDCQRTFYIEC